MLQLSNIRLRDAQSRSREESTLASQLVEAGVLDSDDVRVDSLAPQAGDVTLSGMIRSPHPRPEMTAQELDELSESAKTTLPLYRPSGAWEKSGWYEIDNVEVARAHPTADDVWEYRLSLTRAGTRGDSFRALRTRKRQLDHHFGNATDAIIGIPADTRKTLWYDPETQERAPASPTATVATAVGDVDRYALADGTSALSASPDEPTLLYDVTYTTDAGHGVRSYDTRGKSYKKGGDGIRQWQTIHQTGHDIDDPITLSNGRIRIRVTEPDTDVTGELTAEEWDDSTGAWTDISLPSTDWAPLDLDITQIGQHRERAELTFQNQTNSNLYTVDLALGVGDGALRIGEPADEGDIPADLENHLNPIASTSLINPQPTRTLVPRDEVRYTSA